MDIASIKQTSAVLPAGQSSQDSHEVNIQKQILNLQEKMRGITYDREMSTEEKSDEKKSLQEKIQNLNSELTRSAKPLRTEPGRTSPLSPRRAARQRR